MLTIGGVALFIYFIYAVGISEIYGGVVKFGLAGFAVILFIYFLRILTRVSAKNRLTRATEGPSTDLRRRGKIRQKSVTNDVRDLVLASAPIDGEAGCRLSDAPIRSDLDRWRALSRRALRDARAAHYPTGQWRISGASVGALP